MTSNTTAEVDEEFNSLLPYAMLSKPYRELSWIEAVREDCYCFPYARVEVGVFKKLTQLSAEMSGLREALTFENPKIRDLRLFDGIRYELCLVKKILFIVPGCPQNYEEIKKLGQYLFRDVRLAKKTKEPICKGEKRNGGNSDFEGINFIQKRMFDMYFYVRTIKYYAWATPQQSDRFQPLCRFILDQIDQIITTLEQRLRPRIKPSIDPSIAFSRIYDYHKYRLKDYKRPFPAKFLEYCVDKEMVAEDYKTKNRPREFCCKELDPSKLPPEWVINEGNHYVYIAHYCEISVPARFPLRFLSGGNLYSFSETMYERPDRLAYAYCHNENCFDPSHHVVTNVRDMRKYLECPGGIYCEHPRQCPWPGSIFVRYQ